MTEVRLPKTKKSYHSKAVPAAEAATTVRRRVLTGAGTPSTAISAMPHASPDSFR